MERFGIRVAIVEPGVVVTPTSSKAALRRPASPASMMSRLLLLDQKQMLHVRNRPTPPGLIDEAATSPEPRLRWLVGEDARLLVAGRQRMSDEEYVAGGRAMPDDQYLEEIEQHFGFTWRRSPASERHRQEGDHASIGDEWSGRHRRPSGGGRNHG